MANALVLGQVAHAAVATLRERLGVTDLVHRDFAQDIVNAKKGDTLNVRKPAVFEAKDFDHATGIEIQDINEGTVPVKLNRIADVSFELTDTELTMSVDEFAQRLLVPAMDALSVRMNRDLVAHAVAAISAEVGSGDGSGAVPKKYSWDDHKVLIDAGAILAGKNVPLENRRAVIGSLTKAEWQGDAGLQGYDKSGDTQALRQGSVGAGLHGFDVFSTQLIAQPAASPTTGDPTTEVGLAFHRDAFTFGNAALYIPAGANAHVSSHDGLTLRVIQAYDANKKKTVFSVDCLYGISTLDAEKAVLIKGADAA